jgi:hypothetical protein
VSRRATAGALLGMAALAAAALAAPGRSAGSIAPYLEIGQVLSTDFGGEGETLTYSRVAAGVDASYSSRRTEVQISYQYERRFAWKKDIADDEVHDGLALGRLEVTPGLSLEGGALATRARADIRGQAPDLFAGDERNTSQAYAAYVGPTLSTNIGELQVDGTYRLGYARVETPDDVTIAGGQPALDRYSTALSHTATASVGMRPGTLPFGWTASGGMTWENSGRLSQHYRERYGRFDVVLPVSYSFALTGGIGYEDIRLSTRRPVIGADGLPVIGADGRYLVDRTSPRLVSYDDSGLIYDGGIQWRPSPRTSLELRAGHRYGGTIYTGLFEHQISPTSSFQLAAYDGIQSFGRSLTGTLDALPTQFQVPGRGLGNPFGGCVFGTAGSGACLSPALQSAATENFHNRGGYALWSGTGGRWAFGFAAGYDEREYIAPRYSDVFSLDGVTDKSVTVTANARREFGPRDTLDLAVYGNWYRSGLFDEPEVLSLSGIVSYYHNFTPRLVGLVSAGVYAGDQDGFGSDYSGSLEVGLRYQF